MKSNSLHAWTSFLSLYETPTAFGAAVELFTSGLPFALHLNTVYSAFVVFIFPFEQNTLTLAQFRLGTFDQDLLFSAFYTSAGVKIITVFLDISPH